MRLSAVRGASVALATALVTFLTLPAAPASAAGEVSIKKFVNGEQAGGAPGPSATSGAKVRFRYVITVASSEALYDFVVTDTGAASPNCDLNGDGAPDGYNGHPGPLSSGSQFTCWGEETAGSPGATSASIGRVRAYSFDASQTFEAQAVSHYTTVAPTTTSPPPTPRSSSSTSPSSDAPSTATSAASTTGRRSSEAATTQTSAEPETTSTANTQRETTASSPQYNSTRSTTLGGDGISSGNGDATTSTDPDPSTTAGSENTISDGSGTTASSTNRPSTDVAQNTDQASAATSEPDNTAADNSGADSTAADTSEPDRTEGQQDDLGATDDEDDEPPSRLAFSDGFTFSPLLALVAAAAGIGIALASHQLGQRKRNSASGLARG